MQIQSDHVVTVAIDPLEDVSVTEIGRAEDIQQRISESICNVLRDARIRGEFDKLGDYEISVINVQAPEKPTVI